MIPFPQLDWFLTRRSDVSGAAAAGAVCAVALVADRTFTHDPAVGVGGCVGGDVAGSYRVLSVRCEGRGWEEEGVEVQK